jgi:hypothetical protein
MVLETIHCFLAHPGKGDDPQPRIGGTSVPKRGRLYYMLRGIFDRSDTECNTEIIFSHNALGLQQNDCRDLLLSYIGSRTLTNGRKIAARLQSKTTHKSGLGLLFLMWGNDGHDSKLVLSRFPADQGILAEENRDQLKVEFLEKVFMKSATAYKAAAYEWDGIGTGMWIGRAVDRQINSPQHELAQYWIREFLASELRTTSAGGTRRLAIALRTAISELQDASSKAQITAAVTLAGSLNGQTTTAEDFLTHFGLDDQAKEAVRKATGHDSLVTENFQFDASEFERHIAFRSIELSNGGILSADATRFDQVFQQETVDESNHIIRVMTQGRVVDERLRKVKP